MPPAPKRKIADSRKNRDLKEKAKKKQSRTDSFPIVCLGASAGGLKSLEAFLSNVPDQMGVAFVVISHTNPDRTSLLPDILRRTSGIPVKIIEEGMVPEQNTVYLPPSNRDLVIDQEKFHLKDIERKDGLHLPIDRFLESLSKAWGKRSGCAILSGTGTDGTHGLRLIKEAGGVTLAETKNSAGHFGMPQSAIETGMVDFILEPARMPGRLIDYFEHPVTLQDPAEVARGVKDGKQIPKSLHQIIQLLAKNTGHDFFHYKKNTLIRRIERRMSVTRSKTAAEYLDYLRRNDHESEALFQDLLIGVTEFFRDPETFILLKEKVLPALFSRRDENADLRAWFAGCATGEEVYSAAMVICEYLEEHGIRCPVQLFGTDIDPKAIDKARQGVYLQNIAAKVSPERLQRFFSRDGDRYRVEKEIRDPVVFAVQDILRDPPFTQLDLLFCRNLLIYLEPEAQNRLIPILHYSLKPEGLLLLGSSESTGGFAGFFNMLDKRHSIYRKKEGPVTARPAIEFPVREKIPEQTAQYIPPGSHEKPQVSSDIAQATERLLLKKHTPSCVIVDQAGRILHVHGRTGKYLELPAGKQDLDVSNMAREGLQFALSSALGRASASKKEIRRRRIRVKTNSEFEEVDLTVTPLSEPSPLENTFMILFEETRGFSETPALKRLEEGEANPDLRRNMELEQELMKLKEVYKSALEALKTSNEELRSTNEEVQSTNEELESSREELQSLNEELNTVNAQLQNKNEALSEAYLSITDVLNSTKIAIVFLNNDLSVKRFTPETASLINLIETDANYPTQNIGVRLYDGSYHDVDSDAFSFELCAKIAFRQSARKASPKILEP
ncbi:MAG: CheR family methyltransferase, partial [Desulfobacterales bacterium]